MVAHGGQRRVAGPFADACVHLRVSAPPSNGLAVAPLAPSLRWRPRGGVASWPVARVLSRTVATAGWRCCSGRQAGIHSSSCPSQLRHQPLDQQFLDVCLAFILPK